MVKKKNFFSLSETLNSSSSNYYNSHLDTKNAERSRIIKLIHTPTIHIVIMMIVVEISMNSTQNGKI